MSYPPPRPPYSQEPAPGTHPSSAVPFPSPPFNHRTPPPPPPKPSSHDASRISTPLNGPPLPPPPPDSSTHPPPPSDVSHTGPPPPTIDSGYLPAFLKDKSQADLQTLLNTPSLLSALALSPPHAHPSLAATLSPIHSLLAANTALATHLLSHAAALATLRDTTSTHLLHLHALERQWRHKQALLDDALAPFAPKALHQRLVASIGEQEAYLAALEESFMEGEGRASERETGEFLKRWREGRRVLEVRRERRERWEEGRVGGWR
ncbi:hypothetical protein MMC13_004644 [Lambiella insularis]|nr:hypothetical protein [Lambiella insularis]